MSAASAEILHFPAPPTPEANNRRFPRLVERHRRDLHRYALWLCHDPALAEDLVQETFLRAWRALDTIRDEQATKSWLLTIVRREHARLYERYRPEFKDVEAEQLPGWDGDDKSTEAFVLRRALEQLSPDYREPLLLQVLAGHSCEEIGEILGISRGAVMTRVFRAKQKLRVALDGSAA